MSVADNEQVQEVRRSFIHSIRSWGGMSNHYYTDVHLSLSFQLQSLVYPTSVRTAREGSTANNERKRQLNTADGAGDTHRRAAHEALPDSADAVSPGTALQLVPQRLRQQDGCGGLGRGMEWIVRANCLEAETGMYTILDPASICFVCFVFLI